MDAPSWNAKVIVVGVYGSTQSRHAARLATSMALRSGANLHIMTVVRPPEGWWGVVGSPPTTAALSKSLTEASEEILDSIISEIDLDEIEHETIEEMGDPAGQLIDYTAQSTPTC
jgi:nucleotide-binding universal stress UspA family protein